MKHYHEHEGEPVPGLPHELPEGEQLLWQGRPDWRALARETFKLHWLAAYFGLLFALRLSSIVREARWADAPRELGLTLVWSLACLGLVTLLAYLNARCSLYTITSRRVVMRIGIALPVTWNLPFKRLAAAQLATRRRGDGDVVLELVPPDRIAWLQFWPHTQPGRYLKARPCLRALPEPERVAAQLSEAVRAWSADTLAPVISAPAQTAGHAHGQAVPRGVLWAAFGLMLASIGLAALGGGKAPGEPGEAGARQVLELRFEDRPDGTLAVLDGPTQRELKLLPPGSNNFVRGVLRGMFRGRKAESLGRDAQFRLAREADGRLTLEDAQLGRRIELSSFGPDNVAAFAALLAAGSSHPDPLVTHASIGGEHGDRTRP